MFRFSVLFAVLAFATAAFAPSPAAANDFSSSTRAKIHRAKLRSSMLKAQDEDSRPIEPCQTGSLDIGTIEIERGARVPSEVTVVVDGDVINLNDGQGSHVCR